MSQLGWAYVGFGPFVGLASVTSLLCDVLGSATERLVFRMVPRRGLELW